MQLDDTIFIENQEYVPLLKERKSRYKKSAKKSNEDISPVFVLDTTIIESAPISEVDNIEPEVIRSESVLEDVSNVVTSTIVLGKSDSIESVSDVANTTRVEVLETKTTEVDKKHLFRVASVSTRCPINT